MFVHEKVTNVLGSDNSMSHGFIILNYCAIYNSIKNPPCSISLKDVVVYILISDGEQVSKTISPS